MTRIRFTEPSGRVLELADPIELSVHEFIERRRIGSLLYPEIKKTWTGRLARRLAAEVYAK